MKEDLMILQDKTKMQILRSEPFTFLTAINCLSAITKQVFESDSPQMRHLHRNIGSEQRSN